jgi:hypothetical protein
VPILRCYGMPGSPLGPIEDHFSSQKGCPHLAYHNSGRHCNPFSGLRSTGLTVFSINNLTRQSGRFIVTSADVRPNRRRSLNSPKNQLAN